MQHKIWYKNAEPTVIISVNKTVGEADETSFLSDTWPDDQEFYAINHDAHPVLVRKVQSAIDAIKAARAQAIADAKQKRIDAKAQYALGKFDDVTYAQIDTYVDNTMTDLAGAKVVVKRLAKLFKAYVEANG